MSWSCNIETDKDIKEKDVQDIIDNLPEKYTHSSLVNYGLKIRQIWGWTTRCDVYNPDKNSITIGGAYTISGDIAEEFVKYFENKLKKKDYKIIDKEWSW